MAIEEADTKLAMLSRPRRTVAGLDRREETMFERLGSEAKTWSITLVDVLFAIAHLSSFEPCCLGSSARPAPPHVQNGLENVPVS
jgi:hypothetical protein